ETQSVCGVVQLNATFFRLMNAAQVHSELSIDVDPHVVVAPEQEFFTAVVLELGMQLGGKVKPVFLPTTPLALLKRVSHALQRKERRGVKDEGIPHRLHPQINHEGEIDRLDVVVPLRERLRA